MSKLQHFHGGVDLAGPRPEVPGSFPGIFHSLLFQAVEAQKMAQAQGLECKNPTIEAAGFVFTFQQQDEGAFLYVHMDENVAHRTPWHVQVSFPISEYKEASTEWVTAYKIDTHSEERLVVSGYGFWAGRIPSGSHLFYVNSGEPRKTVYGVREAFDKLEMKLQREWNSNRRAVAKAQREWDAAHPAVVAQREKDIQSEAQAELVADSIEFAAALAKAQRLIETMQGALSNGTFTADLCAELHFACNAVSAQQRIFKGKHCPKKKSK